MKTLKLKLKKDVLIVDINHFNRDGKLQLQEILNNPPNGYEFLCDGSELTEEIASEFFEYDDFLNCFEAYVDTVPSIDKSALKLFIKIFESKKFHWLENTIKHPKDYEVFPDSLSLYAEQEKLHLAAEEKTFRNPLIFVKK